MPSDKKTKSGQMREDLQKIIDMIPENKEDSISIRNMLRDTLTGAADMLFYFRRAIETGESPTPEQMMQTTMDFAPVPAGVAAKTMPKNAVGIFGSRITNPKAPKKWSEALNRLKQSAQAAEDSGISEDEIWQKYRLFKDANGEWNFEIPTNEIKLDFDQLDTLYKQHREKLLSYADQYREETGQTLIFGSNPVGTNKYFKWLREKGIPTTFERKVKDVLVDSPQARMLKNMTNLGEVKVDIRDEQGIRGSFDPQFDTLTISKSDLDTWNSMKKNKKLQDTMEGVDQSDKDQMEDLVKLSEKKVREVFWHELEHGQQAAERNLGVNKSWGSNTFFSNLQLEKIKGIQDQYNFNPDSVSDEDYHLLKQYTPLLSYMKTKLPEYIKAYQDAGVKNPERAAQDYLTYFANKGEVGARNSGFRDSLPESKTRTTVPTRTEDVPREFQIDDDQAREAAKKQAKKNP